MPQVNERRKIHDLFDVLVVAPSFTITHRSDVHDRLHLARASCHDDNTIGEVYRFLNAMGDTKNCAFVVFADSDEFFLHHNASLRIE